jgi:hypothetical protein
MTLRVGLTSTAVALLATSACVDHDRSQDRFVAVDSAGIVVVHSTLPRIETPAAVRSAPIAVVEPDFGEPDNQLYIADRAASLDNGRFVVGNRGTNELFFFSESGVFEGVLGGQGDGPGEFQRLRDIYTCAGNRLIVEEVSRVSILDGVSMGFEQTVSIAGHLAESSASITGIREDCGAALLEEGPDDFPQRQPGIFAFPATLYWSDFADGSQDTVGVFVDMGGPVPSAVGRGMEPLRGVPGGAIRGRPAARSIRATARVVSPAPR